MPKRNETLKFSVAFAGKDRSSATTTIVDTSYPMSYSTRWSANSAGTGTITSINEGSSAYFIIETDNVSDGTVLKVVTTATGSGKTTASANDFSDYLATQNVTINSNKGYIKLTPINDLTTEGPETVTATLTSQSGAALSSATLTINDTSLTPAPTYGAGWYSSSAGTTAITSINEGSTAWLVINGTNVPKGTIVTVKLSGTGITAADFTDNLLQKDVVIQNNVGKVSFGIAADLLTEGTETVLATLTQSNKTVATASLKINDTSVTAVREVYWASDAAGKNRKTDFTWGENQYLIVTSDNTSGSVSVSFKGTLKETELSTGSLKTVSIPLSLDSTTKLGKGVYRLQTFDEDDVSLSNNKWYNMSAKRAANKEYTNDTGETIRIAIMVMHTESNAIYSSLVVDNVLWSQCGGHMDGGTLYYRYTLKATIRPGAKYRLNSQFVVESWAELRPSA